MEQQHNETLQRGLKNRHIQLIALGGAVGAGLFLGSSSVIKEAGPSIILGYMIAGFIAFLIMRQLGEMVVEEPVAGGFSHFADKYWGSFAGFVAGWNYWALYILVAMAELTAVGKYMQFWLPSFPTWITVLFFFIIINAINLANIKIFGEMEFWFALIKITVIISMILFGGWLLLNHKAGQEASIKNLWNHGGFLPNGITKLVMMMPVILFSFGGLEMVGITAAEADKPEDSIPKAINQVLWRVLIFYIGSLIVVLSLTPWTNITNNTSPFVLIFHNIGDVTVANTLNIVIIIAALSIYNSCVYCNSRTLFGLAQQGNAPKFFLKLNKNGVPITTIFVSAIATAICVLMNLIIPGEAFSVLLSMVVSTLIINWSMISLTHIKFRKIKDQRGEKVKFKALFYPVSNWICLFLMISALVIISLTPMIISVWLIPVWLLILIIGYNIKNRLQCKINI